MPTPLKDRPNPENPSPEARLDGWKDIATHLGKAERTVKRWEADRGLPIHRVPGGGRASVYAYAAELDEWLKSSSAEAETVDPGKDEVLLGTSNGAHAGMAGPGEATDARDARLEPTETTIASGPAGQSEHSSPPAQSDLSDRLGQPGQLGQLDRSRGISSRSRLVWALVLAGLFLIVLSVFLIRRSGVPFSRMRSLLAVRQPAPAPTSPPAVSDAEKAMAHDLYLKGRYEWNQRTPDSLNRALDAFTQAIVHDPNDAKAYVGLADTYDLLRQYTTMPDPEAYSRAIVAARRAVELDDSLAEAHRALAYSEMYGSWEFADAEKEFRRAIELNPKDPEARRWYANAFGVPGWYPESLAQIEKAQELDPTSHVTLADKGWMLYNAGRTDEAIAILKEVEQSVPQFRSPHVYLMMISLDRRDYPTYLAEGQKTAEAMNDPVLKDIVASARAGYARGGGRGLMQELYAKQKQYYAAGKVTGTMLAKTCVLMGKRREALDLLDQAYARHESEVFGCLSHPDLLTLKDEPRYKALVKKINFPPPPAGA
jgi:tetratricopeptide (TPR) repeat protein